MEAIRITQFDGELPALSPRQLPYTFAQQAMDVELRRHELVPTLDSADVTTLPDANRKSIYLFDDITWLSWTTDVDVAESPIYEDGYKRIFYTGDGVPKVRGLEGLTYKVYDLGIPKPINKPTVTAQQKSQTAWTRTWEQWWEDKDGTRHGQAGMTEGTQVIETTPGKGYTVANFATAFPKPGTAAADAIFVMSFVGKSDTGAGLGRLYPAISRYGGAADLYVQGAKVSGDQANGAADAVLTLDYDTSRTSDYVIDRRYVYTFVSVWGEEGPPSEQSDNIGIDPSQDAVVGGMSISVAGNHHITHKRLYATTTSITTGVTLYQQVAEISLVTGAFTDNMDVGSRGDVLPSKDYNETLSDWEAPPAALKGLRMMAGGFAAGFDGKTVYFSEPDAIHAWPRRYALTCKDYIVGIETIGNTLYVMTVGQPEMMMGIHPANMDQQKINVNQACVSKRGIVNMGTFVAYPSPDGYAVLPITDDSIITRRFFLEQDWRALNPATMIAENYDDQLIVFADGTTLVFQFSPDRAILRRSSETAQGVYRDNTTDTLYLIQGSNVVAWEKGTTANSATWQSKEYVYPREKTWAVARVIATGYPLTFQVYRDAALLKSLTVSSNRAFMLPSMARAKQWSFKVTSTGTVNELAVGTSIQAISAQGAAA